MGDVKFSVQVFSACFQDIHGLESYVVGISELGDRVHPPGDSPDPTGEETSNDLSTLTSQDSGAPSILQVDFIMNAALEVVSSSAAFNLFAGHDMLGTSLLR